MRFVRSVATVGSFTFMSRVLGFVRDVLIANLLGTGPIADALVVALRLPQLFRRPLGTGVLNSSFVPLFADRMQQEGEDGARRFAEGVLAVLLLAMLSATIVGQISMPWLMYGLAPGFAENPPKFDLAVKLSQLTLPYIFLATLGALLGGILNAMGRFAVAAAAPVLLNVSTVFVLVVVAPFISLPAHAIAVAVSISGVFQLLCVVIVCQRMGMTLRLVRPQLSADVRRFFRRVGPTFLSGGVAQINLFVASIVASFHAGGPSFLYYAERLYQLPLGVTAGAIGVVLLPELTRHRIAGRHTEAMNTLNRYCEIACLVTWPAAVALVIISEPIVRLFFERGAFDASATEATAYIVAAFALGLPAYVIARALMAAFFARGDTLTPFRYASFAFTFNIALSLILSRYLAVTGIALATAAAGWILMALLAWRLWRVGKLTIDARFRRRVPRIALAGLAMGAALWLGLRFFDNALTGTFEAQLSAVTALVLGGLLSFVLLAWLLGAITRSDILRAVRVR